MMIAIGLLAGVLLHLTHRRLQWRINRSDKLALAVYAHKTQGEEAFPFDYLSR
jgi:hypothetical protein